MRITSTIIICILCCVYTIKAQSTTHQHHKRNEIGISTGILYAIDDKEWGSGLHVHYFHTLGEHSRWSIGGFAEQAWFDNKHFSVGLGAKFKIIERLHIGTFPGITIAKHNNHHTEHTDQSNKNKTKFSTHMELVYDLVEWKRFHLGPVFDYSLSKNDSHITLGIHAAYCF